MQIRKKSARQGRVQGSRERERGARKRGEQCVEGGERGSRNLFAARGGQKKLLKKCAAIAGHALLQLLLLLLPQQQQVPLVVA